MDRLWVDWETDIMPPAPRGVTTAPQTPQCGGGGRRRRVKEAFCRWVKEIVTLGPTSADHLILIHQVKQSYVSRRKYINDKNVIRRTTNTKDVAVVGVIWCFLQGGGRGQNLKSRHWPHGHSVPRTACHPDRMPSDRMPLGYHKMSPDY